MNEAINSFVGRHGVCPGSKLPPAIFRTEAEQEEFLRLVYESGERVGLIVWHEYFRAWEQIITGMGGYADPLNKGFMWAETQIPCADLDEKTHGELISYMAAVKNEYNGYRLTPEFYIKGYETL